MLYRIPSRLILASTTAFLLARAMSVLIRRATVHDLPSVHNLIQQSFDAMTDHYGEDVRPMMDTQAKSLIEKNLIPEVFSKEYLEDKGSNFWVACQDNGGDVIGCVGIKRTTVDDAELVRMAVNPSIRGGGVGSKLIDELVKYAVDTKVKRIFLVTGNPLSAKFYAKHQFLTTQSLSFPFNERVTMAGVKMHRYLGEKLIRKVAIVGGTHGNERIGIELVKQFHANPDLIKRSTLQVMPLLANVEAAKRNIRFVDEDLNRQFDLSDLQAVSGSPLSYEKKLAQELNKLLGPKGAEESAVDFIIDLHTSTSNVGSAAFVAAIGEDTTALRLSHYLQSHAPELKIVSSPDHKAQAAFVDSIAPRGIGFEIGPIAHGTLQYTALEATRKLIQLTLNYFEERNLKLLAEARETIEKGSEGVRNYEQIVSSPAECAELKEVSAALCPNSLVPPNFPSLVYYTPEHKISFPISPSAEESAGVEEGYRGEMKTLLSSPHKTMIVHPSFEGKDWAEVKEGDEVFISSAEGKDGEKEVVKFSREKFLPPPGPPTPWARGPPPPLYAMFVNEGAYMRENTAFVLYKKQEMNVH